MKLFVLITVILFAVLSAVFFAVHGVLPQYNYVALEVANAVMAVLSLSTYIIVRRNMDDRPQAFVRGVYSASFLKLMVCMVSLLVYVMLNRATIHKPTIFVMFGIYAVYTIAETILLSKLARA